MVPPRLWKSERGRVSEETKVARILFQLSADEVALVRIWMVASLDVVEIRPCAGVVGWPSAFGRYPAIRQSRRVLTRSELPRTIGYTPAALRDLAAVSEWLSQPGVSHRAYRRIRAAWLCP